MMAAMGGQDGILRGGRHPPQLGKMSGVALRADKGDEDPR